MIVRRAFRLFLAFGLAGLVSGCLQPVHSTRFNQGTLDRTLAEISVVQVDGYLGYILKAELDYLLTNGKPAKDTRYQLKVLTKANSGSSIIDAATGRAQMVTTQVEATYELKDIQTGKLKASGKTYASASYDRSQERFATIRAQRDAEERVAKALAERLKIILVTVLAGDPSIEAKPAPDFSPSIGQQDDPSPLEPESAG